MSEDCVSWVIDDNFLPQNIFHAHTGPATSAKCDAGEALIGRIDPPWAWNVLRSPAIQEVPIWWHGSVEKRGVRGRIGNPAVVLNQHLHKHAMANRKDVEVTHPMRSGSTRVYHKLGGLHVIGHTDWI